MLSSSSPLKLQVVRASLVAQLVKNLPAMQETWVWSLGWEDPLEKGKATRSSTLAWRIPWTSPWGRKESDTTERLSLSDIIIVHFNNLKVRTQASVHPSSLQRMFIRCPLWAMDYVKCSLGYEDEWVAISPERAYYLLRSTQNSVIKRPQREHDL